MSFYIKEEDLIDVIPKVLAFCESDESQPKSFIDLVKDICLQYVRNGKLSEKQSGMVARVYWIHCNRKESK